MLKRLALVLLLGGLPALGQEKPAAQASPPRALYRLEYTVSGYEAGKKVHSRSYVLLGEDGKQVRSRIGSRVPVATGQSGAFQYFDVGMHIDATPIFVSDTTVSVRTRIEATAIATKEGAELKTPILQNFQNDSAITIPVDKAFVLTSQDEPGSGLNLQVQLIARVVK